MVQEAAASPNVSRSHHPLSGLWVPIVTPFLADGALDAVSLRRLADRLLADGAHGLVALGTTGEPATMSADERRRVVQVCHDACVGAGRRLMVGAGTNSTQGTMDEIVGLCDGLAVTAALVVVPYYTRPSVTAVIEHFHIVADSSPVPVVMYNIPYRTGVGLDADALLQAGAHPNVIGLKQSVAALDRNTLDVLGRAPSDFAVLAGDDAFIAPTVLMGGAGAISAAGHVCTERFTAMVSAGLSGSAGRAVEHGQALLDVVTAGFAEPSPAVWKGALERSGEITSAYVRRPMTPASPAAIDALLRAKKAAEAALG